VGGLQGARWLLILTLEKIWGNVAAESAF